MTALATLARLVGWRSRANPAGEGNVHGGPYHIIGATGGWLPFSSVPLNFWQSDIDARGLPGCSIVEACVWAYIRAIAQLPGYHKRETGNGGTEIVTTSALSRLLRAPNGYETPSDFLVHLIRSLLLAGNSYWVATRNERNEVTALHWTDPRACHVREVGIAGEDMAAVFYEIGDNPLVDLEGLLGPQASRLIVPARDVLHVKLATPSHPLIGETWLGALASELAQRGAINAATTQAAANMRPAGILTTDLTLTRAQINEISDLWKEKSANMAHGGVPVLQQGIKFQPVTMSADDAKTIEQLKLNDRAVAAVFGVPAILLGISDSATQKSAEAVMAEWLAAGLGWLINHVEVAFDQFIGLNQVAGGREWVEFDTRMLLRSLYKERIDGLVRGVQGGLYSPNEARAMEGYGAVKDGEEPRLQAQVVPLSAWSSTAPATSTPATSPVAESEEEPEETEDEDDRAFAVVQIARRLEAKRASERQAAA